MKFRVVALYMGRVQGVGFRTMVRQLACGYEVTGMVKNLDDGRVELIAEGDKAELEAFLQGMAESGLSSLITRRVDQWSPARGNLKGFQIVR